MRLSAVCTHYIAVLHRLSWLLFLRPTADHSPAACTALRYPSPQVAQLSHELQRRDMQLGEQAALLKQVAEARDLQKATTTAAKELHAERVRQLTKLVEQVGGQGERWVAGRALCAHGCACLPVCQTQHRACFLPLLPLLSCFACPRCLFPACQANARSASLEEELAAMRSSAARSAELERENGELAGRLLAAEQAVKEARAAERAANKAAEGAARQLEQKASQVRAGGREVTLAAAALGKPLQAHLTMHCQAQQTYRAVMSRDVLTWLPACLPAARGRPARQPEPRQQGAAGAAGAQRGCRQGGRGQTGGAVRGAGACTVAHGGWHG